MAYTAIDNPELYFQTKLYTGQASSQGDGTTTAITFDGDEDMAPNLIWIKNRDGTDWHDLTDSVRGVTKSIYPNENDAEDTVATAVTAIGSDGFTVGSNDQVNDASDKYVAWCWKAGTSFTNDASATSVGSIDSAGSINTTAGISIIEYSGTGSQGTIAHGLSAKPTALWFKRLDTTGNWVNYHQSIGATKYLRFDTNAAQITASDEFNDTEPTSAVFTVDTDGAVNASGTDNHIAYSFAEKQGFSKFGSYTGNGNADGSFVYTGFRPAYVMVKKTDSATQVEGWYIFDNKRSDFNLSDDALRANLANAELANWVGFDFLSNGLKVRASDPSINVSGSVYIYMAFAEAPFVNSNGVPCNAR